MTRRILILAACLWLLPAWASAQCAAARIDALCAALAEEMAENLQVRLDRTQPIVAAPFADLHNLKATSELGRVLAEELGGHFAGRGYRVADPRAFMPSPYSRKEHGETALSHQPDTAGSATSARTVLTGTYAQVDGGLLVSARLVQTADQTVLSAASCRLRLSPEVARLLGASTQAAAAKPAPAPLLDLKNKAAAKRVQQALAAQGLNPGKIDGVWGKKSKAALARFRASLAMPATPTWDLATQNALLPNS
jgi:TolB-like protein